MVGEIGTAGKDAAVLRRFAGLPERQADPIAEKGIDLFRPQRFESGIAAGKAHRLDLRKESGQHGGMGGAGDDADAGIAKVILEGGGQRRSRPREETGRIAEERAGEGDALARLGRHRKAGHDRLALPCLHRRKKLVERSRLDLADVERAQFLTKKPGKLDMEAGQATAGIKEIEGWIIDARQEAQPRQLGHGTARAGLALIHEIGSGNRLSGGRNDQSRHNQKEYPHRESDEFYPTRLVSQHPILAKDEAASWSRPCLYPDPTPNAPPSVSLPPSYGWREWYAKPAKPSPEVATDRLSRILDELRLGPSIVQDARRRAKENGSDLGTELIAAGAVSEDALARALAHALELPRAAPAKADRIVERPEMSGSTVLRTCTTALRPRLFVAPSVEDIDRLAALLPRLHAGGQHIFIATPSEIQAHRARASMTNRLNEAIHGLWARKPQFSARTTLTPRQGFVLGLLTCLAVLAAHQLGSVFWTAGHVVLGVFFAVCTLLRFHILLDRPRERRLAQALEAERDRTLKVPIGPMPIYTVLVALYREEEMVAPLVASLMAMHWPASRLDIKLVCEADDASTLAAVSQAITGRPQFELVTVPPSHPRTKPKALNHALPLARGQYVVLYDAEDRPDPDQLLEAWLAFSSSSPDLACVQAPLVIRNGADGWFARMFALEYAVLFRAVHPYLARRDLPIPLGGTSNHFRREALEAVGAWDSFNVAEDADLGIRLARHGYRTGTIHAPTSEIAPLRWRDWRNQRTRWIKGWCQTWLVHMRHPVDFCRELGWVRFLAFQLLFVSMIAGGIMHTIFLTLVAKDLYSFLSLGSIGFGDGHFAWLDLFNLVAAVAVFSLLASSVATKQERTFVNPSLCGLWLYWLLMSVAWLRALQQLFRDPSGWEKTPHREQTEGAASATVTKAVRTS